MKKTIFIWEYDTSVRSFFLTSNRKLPYQTEERWLNFVICFWLFVAAFQPAIISYGTRWRQSIQLRASRWDLQTLFWWQPCLKAWLLKFNCRRHLETQSEPTIRFTYLYWFCIHRRYCPLKDFTQPFCLLVKNRLLTSVGRTRSLGNSTKMVWCRQKSKGRRNEWINQWEDEWSCKMRFSQFSYIHSNYMKNWAVLIGWPDTHQNYDILRWPMKLEFAAFTSLRPDFSTVVHTDAGLKSCSSEASVATRTKLKAFFPFSFFLCVLPFLIEEIQQTDQGKHIFDTE